MNRENFLVENLLDIYIHRIQAILKKCNDFEFEEDCYFSLLGVSELQEIQRVVSSFGEEKYQDFCMDFANKIIEFFKYKFPTSLILEPQISEDICILVKQGDFLIETINLSKKSFQMEGTLKKNEQETMFLQKKLKNLKMDESIAISKLAVYNQKSFKNIQDFDVMMKNLPIMKKRFKKQDNERIFQIQEEIAQVQRKLNQIQVEKERERRKDLILQKNRSLVAEILRQHYFIET